MESIQLSLTGVYPRGNGDGNDAVIYNTFFL